MATIILFAMNWTKTKCRLGFHNRVHTATKPSYLYHDSLNRTVIKSYTCLHCGDTKEVYQQIELM